MAIRTELLSPTYHIMNANAYVEVVGEHGTMMMMMMSSVIVGPLGNYLVPLMIGSKRVAFPRIEALSFWLTPLAYIILLSGLFLGGFPFGWTGYAPLSIEATSGADAYAFAFGCKFAAGLHTCKNHVRSYRYRPGTGELQPGSRTSRGDISDGS